MPGYVQIVCNHACISYTLVCHNSIGPFLCITMTFMLDMVARACLSRPSFLGGSLLL